MMKKQSLRIENKVVKKIPWELFFIFLFTCLYILGAALVSLHRYWQFDAFWLDFGIFDETIWQLSRFHLPVIPTLAPPTGKVVWGDHFNPSAILLAPLYWITNKAEIILVAQAVGVGLSALVGYALIRKKITVPLVRISLIVSYLGFVGLQNALYTDVHNIVFALLPFMLTIWSYFEKKWSLYWLFLLVTLGFQENMGAVGIGLGLYWVIRDRKNMLVGMITILLSLGWALLATTLFIPFFNHGPYNYRPEFPAIWYEWITHFFQPFDLKLRTIVLTLLTFGGLPLFSFATYPLIVEHFLERFVLNTAATRWDLGFHYNALLSPIMFLAVVDVMERWQNNPKARKWLTCWAGVTIFIVYFLHRFYLHGPLILATHPVFYEQTKRNQFIQKFVNLIPPNGLLMTQNNLATHFTHRPVVILTKAYTSIKPDVVAVDIRPGQNPNNFFPLTEEDTKALIASLSADTQYQKQEITDSQLLFFKKDSL